MKTLAAVTIMVSAGLLAGCCHTPEPVVTDTACQWVRPIYVSGQDVLTDQTAKEILAHDEAVASNCPQLAPASGT